VRQIFGFADGPAAAVWVPRGVGILILLQALCTDYELGLVKMIPLNVHLMADYGIGVLLIVSPWLFGFSDRPNNVWIPHLIVGVIVFLTTSMTNPNPRRQLAAR
jgi:hypothetical protein